MRNKLIGGGVAIGVVVLWILWGRFAVEGGKVPWAIINDRNDVLREALASKPSQSEREEGLWRAVHKSNAEAIPLIVAAGTDPNSVKIGENCLLDYPGNSFTVQKALLAGGATPDKCKSGKPTFVRGLVEAYGGKASEPELIELLQQLAKQGYPLDGALEKATALKLGKVAGFLSNPTGATDAGKAQKLALLGGETDSVDRDDLKKICKGEGIAKLPAYKKDAELISPAYAFVTKTDEPLDDSRVLPRWWIADRLQHTQVVACAIVTDKRVVKECKYEGGSVIKYYTATYGLSIRDAKTADQITHKQVTIEATPPADCSMFKMGGNEGVYPEYTKELLPLLRPVLGVRD